MIAVEELKRTHRATWAAGDYPAVAERIDEVPPRDLLERIEIRPGEDVLDVATGTGNAALRAAAEGAQVIGLDLTPELFETAWRRMDEWGVAVDWVEGDAEELPFEDESFDAVLSVFGVQFAPRHQVVARELARVTRPGGRIGLVNWTPEGFIGQLFKAIGAYVPPPAGLQSPALWGTESHIAQLFGPRAAHIHVARKHFNFRYRSTAHWLQVFRDFYGPTHKAFAALDQGKQDALARDITALLERYNVAGPTSLVVPGEYLESVITVR